jgi:hypothetical protein
MANKKFNSAKAEKSARRKAHFANGGTPAMWRGRAATFEDRKKKQNRRSCRKYPIKNGDV